MNIRETHERVDVQAEPAVPEFRFEGTNGSCPKNYRHFRTLASKKTIQGEAYLLPGRDNGTEDSGSQRQLEQIEHNIKELYRWHRPCSIKTEVVHETGL